jgi:death-on-curing protein
VSDERDGIRYLGLFEVLGLHRTVMLRLRRDAEALRDEGALESAIESAKAAAYYEEADIIRQAAVLAVRISQAQAFVDGNKRTAYLTMDSFLRYNDLKFLGRPLQMAQQLEAVASRDDSLSAATDRFEAWLRERVGPRRP